MNRMGRGGRPARCQWARRKEPSRVESIESSQVEVNLDRSRERSEGLERRKGCQKNCEAGQWAAQAQPRGETRGRIRCDGSLTADRGCLCEDKKTMAGGRWTVDGGRWMRWQRNAAVGDGRIGWWRDRGTLKVLGLGMDGRCECGVQVCAGVFGGGFPGWSRGF